MKATEARLLDFLRKSPQFVIPVYQRTYSWTELECLQLWDDIVRTGTDDAISAHFVGSVVYIEKGPYQVTGQSPLMVIDGQQRLATVSVLLEVLARRLGDAEPVDGFSARKLRNYYLLNPEETGERGYKLLLTQTDKESLLALLQQKPFPEEPSLRLRESFEFFEERVASLDGELEPLCKGLAKLVMVDISLSRDQDNPQLIFESMNSMGRELSQADLIRNFVLMGLEPAEQTRLYEDHWRPMETGFGQEAYGSHFDGFMRHYLTFKTGDIPKIRAVYEAFKAYARTPDVAAAGIGALVADIHTFAGHYCAMALSGEPDKALDEVFRDLRDLRVDVAYPLLLELYNDYTNEVLAREELLDAVRLVEAYVFRRAVCSIPTNTLNKTFAIFGRALRKHRYLDSIRAHLLLLGTYRRFPGDEEFRRAFMTRDLYNFRNRSYWLRRLENHGRKERVPVEEYTIEHILPQNEDLSPAWRAELGTEWPDIHENLLHTLGNLTLTGYNAEYSDRPFVDKRDMVGGFKDSPLKLNEGLGTVERWDRQAIRARAGRLAALATGVWQAPSPPADGLDAFRPTSASKGVYTLADHPNLAGGPMRVLFDAFRKEVLALDDCVTEEFLKYYVAFKAVTNFVDVVPQVKRLRLTLNLGFHEIVDSKGVCNDVTGHGRWGNGDVDVPLNSHSELPYVMGLVRQAFEAQMGNGRDE